MLARQKTNSSFQILESHKIDFNKWDDCIEESSNGLVYGLSEYLNYTTDNWKGVVVDNYVAVMPIPWRKKFGITYTYEVPFLQQAGVYSGSDSLSLDEALNALNSFCSYGTYNFNFAQHDQRLQARTNLVLALNSGIEELYQNFTPDAKRIIQHTLNSSMRYSQGDVDEAVAMYKRHCEDSVKISAHQYESFRILCKSLFAQGNVHVRRVEDTRGNTLSIMLLLKFRNRLINIINATFAEGRKLNSNYLLYYSVLKEFAGSGFLFDFEGSEHPGIQRFYRQFTTTNQPYYRYHLNNLPSALKWLKK